MRVIAGEARGKRLRSVLGPRVRPTTDRTKEALFSTLGPKIRGKRVLDLFAGSGALGIEALSRGAAHADFVESEASAAAMIESNLANTGLGDRAQVHRRRAERFVAGSPPMESERYDLVLADPPYDTGVPAGLLRELADGGWLAPDAIVVVEVSSRGQTPPVVGYRLVESRRYGDSRLLYMRRDSGERGQ